MFHDTTQKVNSFHPPTNSQTHKPNPHTNSQLTNSQTHTPNQRRFQIGDEIYETGQFVAIQVDKVYADAGFLIAMIYFLESIHAAKKHHLVVGWMEGCPDRYTHQILNIKKCESVDYRNIICRIFVKKSHDKHKMWGDRNGRDGVIYILKYCTSDDFEHWKHFNCRNYYATMSDDTMLKRLTLQGFMTRRADEPEIGSVSSEDPFFPEEERKKERNKERKQGKSAKLKGQTKSTNSKPKLKKHKRKTETKPKPKSKSQTQTETKPKSILKPVQKQQPALINPIGRQSGRKRRVNSPRFVPLATRLPLLGVYNPYWSNNPPFGFKYVYIYIYVYVFRSQVCCCVVCTGRWIHSFSVEIPL